MMNKRSFANLMSAEKKKYEQNVEKYKKINAAKRLAAKKTTVYADDPLTFKKAIEAEFAIPAPDIVMKEDSVDTLIADEAGEEHGEDAVSLLKAILNKQNQTFERLTNLEARMCSLETTMETFKTWSMDNAPSRPEEMAREKMLREAKVLIHKVHKSIARFTGEEQDEPDVDITASLPISSYEAAEEFEEKMEEAEYKSAVKLFIGRLRGCNTSFEKIFRHLYTDEFIALCNWEGKNGKYALIKFSLASEMLQDAAKFSDRRVFDKAMRKCIEKSHHRTTQKNFHKRQRLT